MANMNNNQNSDGFDSVGLRDRKDFQAYRAAVEAVIDRYDRHNSQNGVADDGYRGITLGTLHDALGLRHSGRSTPQYAWTLDALADIGAHPYGVLRTRYSKLNPAGAGGMEIHYPAAPVRYRAAAV